MSNSKKFSTQVTAGCIIIFCIIVAAIKCKAQTSPTFETGVNTILIESDPILSFTSPVLVVEKPDKTNKWYYVGDYKPFTGARITRLSIAVLQSFFDGCEEARHKDPFVFEKTLGAGPVSFWGHRQDELQYDKNGKHKSEFFNAFRDLHHFDEALDKFGNGSIYLSIGISKICEINRSYKKGIKPRHIWRDIFLDCVITSAVQTATKSITYASFTGSRLFHL